MPPANSQIAQSPADAAAAIRAGGLAIIPTETLYGVAADASNPRAVALLRDLITVQSGLPERFPASTWHTHNAAFARAIFVRKDDPADSTLDRAFEQLLPGPVRLMTAPTAERSDQIRRQLRVAPGVIDDDGHWAIRVPDEPISKLILELCEVPVLAERLSVLGLGDGTRLPENVLERAAAMGISAVVNTGPTRFGQPSTTVRVTGRGVEVVSAGVYEARYIHKKMHVNILFVCTGNTCRSPMAEAIARDLLRRANIDWVSVGSAGIAANEGASMTPEAREALSEMDVAAGAHRSRMLTPALAGSHQKIYALTRAHMRAAQQSVPQSESSRIQILDPQGGDIEDPIGGPLEEYRETAATIRKLVRLRIIELGIDLPSE